MINEQQKPRTAPINTIGLVKIIKYVIEKTDIEPDYNTDSKFIESILDKIKYITNNRKDDDIEDYVNQFIVDNRDLIDNGDFSPERYMIPQKKKFRVEGEEIYSAKMADYYVADLEGYSREYIEKRFEEHDWTIFDIGTFKSNEIYDTWDTEQQIHSIEEIPMNEEVIKNLKQLRNLI